jgi:hypothetical protein
VKIKTYNSPSLPIFSYLSEEECEQYIAEENKKSE